MNSLDDLIHKHFILNNANIFRPYFFKYCNLIYGREYPYNTDNVRKMLECIFNDIVISKDEDYIWLSNINDKHYVAKLSSKEISYKEYLIEYLDEILCQ